MNKTIKKSLSIVLTVVMLLSSLVFTMPVSNAAAFPPTYYNGDEAVTYTSQDALAGKYLVEIDVVKYSPNYSLAPSSIQSEAGDITITYKPNNGLDAEQTLDLEGIIAANEFNYLGNGEKAYYAVLDGFPQKANVSIKKTNLSANDTGIYAGIQVWDASIGMFTPVYDYSKLERSNGVGTASLMFSNISVLLNYYPYAKQGDASGGDLTLPANVTNPTVSDLNFAVTDQWGVTMVSPTITAPTVAGLTFSQNKNIVTIKGTGDANNPSANYRDVTVSAQYRTLNPNASGISITSRSKVCRITNSTTMTYAPTYQNRLKGGLSISFKAGSDTSPAKFALDSAHKMTTTNYLLIKNNSSRTARVTNINNPNGSLYTFSTTSLTIAAGATESVRINDSATATANYNVDAVVTYTLDGLYDASTNGAVSLTTGGTISCVYETTNPMSVRVFDTNNAGRKVDVIVKLVADNQGMVEYVNKTEDHDQSTFEANYYIDTTNCSSYNTAGLKFKLVQNNENVQYFQDEDDYCGKYSLDKGPYANIGSFGFNTSTGTSGTLPKLETEINDTDQSKGNEVPFYGTIFNGSASSASPGKINFTAGKSGGGLQVHARWKSVVLLPNSAYLSGTINVYAYNKSGLNTALSSANSTNPLSCYFKKSAYEAYNLVTGDCALKKARVQKGKYLTNQYAVSQAADALNTAIGNLSKDENLLNASYCVVHQAHGGDFYSPVTDSTCDFYLFEVGASHNLKLNTSYSSPKCNRHSKVYNASVSAKGSYSYVYQYWNIDFDLLNSVISEYNSVAKDDQFVNTETAVGTQLEAALAIDTSETTANPDQPVTQNEVTVTANALKEAMRDLQYRSYDMRTTHKMLDADMQEVNNDIINTYTDVYNRSTTYGAVLDGTADLTDGTYTVKNAHFVAQTDPLFCEYSNNNYVVYGISSVYIVKGDKDITIEYYAKPIDDTRLSELIEDTFAHAGDWKDDFTASSYQEFEDWFNENYDEVLAKTFTVFDEEAYNQVLAIYQSELDKLDPIITDAQVEEINQFISDYEMLSFRPQAYCNGTALKNAYADEYAASQEMLDKIAQNDAGEKAAQAILDSTEEFAISTHEPGEKILITEPTDGVAGSYSIMCANCNQRVSSRSLANPVFNNYSASYYDYANRGASLRYSEKEIEHYDTQGVRFPAACFVPEGATVTDFGFVHIPTRNLNGGQEPTDNTPINVNALVQGAMYVTTESLFGKNYTIHPVANGSVYTFNLVLNIKRANWDQHVAVRGYITYELDGLTVTVYDKTYSSRSAQYVAECVMNNPNELEYARQVIGAKFGIK